MIKKRCFAILVFLVGLMIPLVCWATNMDPDEYKVVEVIDGDTLVVATEAGKQLRVRMVGIDAPELNDTTKARIDAKHNEQDLGKHISMGQRARNYLVNDLRIMDYPTVYLEYDRHDLDAKGNTLAYVHICPISVAYPPERYMNCPKCIMNRGDHYCYMLNALMVHEGLVRTAPVPPNSLYTRFFDRLNMVAKQEKRGIWATSSTGSSQNVKVVSIDPTGVKDKQGLISQQGALKIARTYVAEYGYEVPEEWQHIGAIHHDADGVWQVGINYNPAVDGDRAEVWIDDRSGDVVKYLGREHFLQ